MEYQTRTYPLFSACGLNCGLCPRFHTNGASKCPGCAGAGFSAKHPACGILSCCQRQGLEYCHLCAEYPCKKYNGADESDSFISHQNQLRDLAKASNIGLPAYEAELNKKVELLEHLLANYDDGRRKSFFCVAVNLLNIADVKAVMAQITAEATADTLLKEKSALAVSLLQAMAEQRGVSLKLRKKG